jgi:hypothetical protein
MPALVRTDAYLSALPGGVSAYPECQAKGVLVRMLASEEGYAGVAPTLPQPFRKLMQDPPMGSEWVPEVHFQALLYALGDATGQDDEAILAGIRPRDRRMFESPAYRILMETPSPAALLRGADLRWANWHRGSTLEVEGIADDGVGLAIAFPRGLFDGLHLRVIGESFLAALDLTRAASSRVEIREAGPGRVRYRVAWD